MLLAQQHEVDGAFTCARGPSTRHVTGAAGMKMCALREQCHEQERCTVGGCSRQSNRDAARARSWHSGLACVLAAGSRYSRKPSNPRLLDDAELDHVHRAVDLRVGRVDRTDGASDGAGAEDRRRHLRHRPGDADVENIGFDTLLFPTLNV